VIGGNCNDRRAVVGIPLRLVEHVLTRRGAHEGPGRARRQVGVELRDAQVPAGGFEVGLPVRLIDDHSNKGVAGTAVRLTLVLHDVFANAILFVNRVKEVGRIRIRDVRQAARALATATARRIRRTKRQRDAGGERIPGSSDSL